MLNHDEQQGISSQEVHDLTSACEEMLTQEDAEQKEEMEVPTIQEEEEELVCIYFSKHNIS